jgi:cytochrome c-type biogenesis protein CcmH/NrfG
LKPTNKEGLISLANVLRDLQRLEEATGFYRLARRLHPTSDDAVRRCNAHR